MVLPVSCIRSLRLGQLGSSCCRFIKCLWDRNPGGFSFLDGHFHVVDMPFNEVARLRSRYHLYLTLDSLDWVSGIAFHCQVCV